MPTVPPTSVGSDPYTYVVKSADQSVASSTTLTNDSELFFSAVSGTSYLFDCVMFYSNAGGGTADFKFAMLGEDGTQRGAYSNVVGTTTADGGMTVVSTGIANAPSGTSYGTAAIVRMLLVTGYYIAASNFNLRVQWCQVTSDPSATVVKAGSYLRYRTVG